MARSARKQSSSGLYHVLLRAQRGTLFASDAEKRTFLALLELISAGEAGASQNQRYGAIEIVYKGKGKEEKA